MKKIEESVIKFIERHTLINKGENILIGLSGGADSVFAFHFFVKYKQKYNIGVFACHLNHMLRGSDAYADEEFCRELANKNLVPFYSAHEDIYAYSELHKLSIEEAARIKRYEFFRAIALKTNSKKIVTAHNKDDNAETVLYNMIKGSGINGVTGIPIQRDEIIRPFLSVTKKEIEEYIRYHKLDYRTDASNFDINFSRNFLRHKVFPLIKKELNPAISDSLFRFSRNMDSVKIYLSKQLPEYYDEFIECSEKKVIVKNPEELSENGSYVFYEIVSKALSETFEYSQEFNDLEKLMELIRSKVGATHQLRNNLIAIKDRDKLIIVEAEKFADYSYNLVPGNFVTVKEAGIEIKVSRISKEDAQFSDKYEIICMDNVPNAQPEFSVRNWRNGDRFKPLGMKGMKSVSDFLTDNKLSVYRKKNYPVLVNRNNVVYVIGLRIDERYKATENCKNFYKIEYRKL